MKRYHIFRGDKTTAGGTVISGNPACKLEGRPVACEGDKVECPACGTVGVIVCTGPHRHAYVDKAQCALEGDQCQCQCSPAPILIANQTSISYDFGPSSAPLVGMGKMGAGRYRAAATRSSTPGVVSPTRETAPPAAALGQQLVEEEEEEEPDEGIIVRIGLFFNGTGNNMANAELTADCQPSDVGYTEQQAREISAYCVQEGFDAAGGVPDSSYGNASSNVARLYDLYVDEATTQLSEDASEASVKVYLEGIGTSSGQPDSLYGQGLGIGATGAAARVEQAPPLVVEKLRQLRRNNPGLVVRRIEFDLFGFSRGAAAARHCANELLKGARSRFARVIPVGSSGLAEGFNWRHGQDFIINFIGLFDTVPGISNPLLGDFTPHDGHNPGLNLRLAPGCAKKIVQLVAQHEFRHNFSVMLSDHDIRVPGAHSDLGGGYPPAIRETVLLTRPEHSEIPYEQKARESQAWRTAKRQVEAHLPPYGNAFTQPGQPLSVQPWAIALPYNPHQDARRLKRVYAAVVSKRVVRGALSLVYLRVMRKLAVRAGVPFGSIKEKPKLALPAELKPISRKLTAYALGEAPNTLTEAEMDLLRRYYIHLSANWNAARGKNNSDLSVLFINRPASRGRRAEYPNE
ncbi:PAAR domain-containing protein [Pseudomonas japonica]|uniref:PAAR domain-containing protein n=2 Tax=Pseudomonas japonica TaxID=256466 RepID=UPI0015E3477A|nr:PAAR domain-containing protein [Pseudomonas japonica]MBA1244510.1 type IV secretion protein Rhs [Pseudomonas japonica]